MGVRRGNAAKGEREIGAVRMGEKAGGVGWSLPGFRAEWEGHMPATWAPDRGRRCREMELPLIADIRGEGEGALCLLGSSPRSEPWAGVQGGGWQRRQKRRRFLLDLSHQMQLSPARLSLCWHRHRFEILRVEKRERRWILDLHRVLLDAPSPVVAALARYLLEHNEEARQQIESFADAQLEGGAQRGLERRGGARGTFIDLQSIFDALNFRYFNGKVRAEISWLEGADWAWIEAQDAENQEGPTQERAPERTQDLAQELTQDLGLAAYCVEDQSIFVHRSLDAPDIPRFYLEWIVYHEMLHQVHEEDLRQGRDHHGADFLRDEAAFGAKDRALAWQRENWARLQATLQSPVRRLDG